MDPIGAALDIVHTEQWCPCVWKVGHATALALRRCDKSKEAVSRAILAAGVPQSWEVAMKTLNVTLATLLSGAAVALAPWGSQADPVASRGSTPYVTHFIFRPLMSLDDTGVGKATLMEAVGTTQNMKGEKMLDKMAARCVAINVELDAKKYIDGVCVLTDSDGDRIVSTFDTRDIDKSKPEMNCGTHVIVGGTGKFKGITGKEPFACNPMPAPAGPGGYTALDIPHITTWEIKK
jgi:hypothetical protein